MRQRAASALTQPYVRLGAIILMSLISASNNVCSSQARPSGFGRLWTEVGAEVSVQSQDCTGCTRNGKAVGPTLAAALGFTLPSGFGLALSGKTFQEFHTEHSQNSKFLLLQGQYTIPKAQVLTLNLGVGRAWHDGDPTDSHMNAGRSNAVGFGSAVRLPASSRAALTVKADVINSVGGTTSFRPTTFNFGLGFSLSTACRNQSC